MRVLILHSDIPPDAPPDEQDTLVQAEAVARALQSLGHETVKAAFTPDMDRLKSLTRNAELLFNLVEAIEGSGYRAAEAVSLFDTLAIPYTGNGRDAMLATCDKPLAKRRLSAAGLPTPAWSEPPDWESLSDSETYIVKSAREDASLGLDDAAVMRGRDAVMARARYCAGRYGGKWFAEAFVDGREFNVALLEEDGAPRVLPIAEMRFESWPADKPKIVGYPAKWEEASHEATHTVRDFSWGAREPGLAAQLRELSEKAWKLFGLSGYARVDFRVDRQGRLLILELNPNPCVEPNAGFAAAAREAGYAYRDVIARIVAVALRR